MLGIIFFVFRALALWAFGRFVLTPCVNKVTAFLMNIILTIIVMMDVMAVVLTWSTLIFAILLLKRYWNDRGFEGSFDEEVRPAIRGLANRATSLYESCAQRAPILFDTIETINRMFIDPLVPQLVMVIDDERKKKAK